MASCQTVTEGAAKEALKTQQSDAHTDENQADTEKGQNQDQPSQVGKICGNRGYDQKCYGCEILSLLIVDAVVDEVAEAIDGQID